MDKKQKKTRIIAAALLLLLNVICTVLVLTVPIETTGMKILSCYLALALVVPLVWRFPTRFYLLTMGFVFLASTLGSCVNLYWHVGFYDLFVHYASGVLLAEGGYIIMERLLRRRGLSDDRLIKKLFALFFSCAGAGLWEIYEFSADSLMHMQLQGTKGNTMGDIIAGVLGAVTYFVVASVIESRKKRKVPI